MIENKMNTTTGEPVNQAPATTEASTTTEPAATPTATEQTPATNTLATPAKVEPPVYPGIKPTTEASAATNPYGAAPVSPIMTSGGRMLLPVGYLSSGSLLDENGVMSPDYLEKYPQALAQSLKPLKVSTYHRAFLTKAKEANKKKVPYSTKKNCAQTMVLQAMKLVSRAKDPAPHILLDMMRAVTATVVDDATFEALYVHLDAIETYMLSE